VARRRDKIVIQPAVLVNPELWISKHTAVASPTTYETKLCTGLSPSFTAGLESQRVVEKITAMIYEDELVIDVVLTALQCGCGQRRWCATGGTSDPAKACDRKERGLVTSGTRSRREDARRAVVRARGSPSGIAPSGEIWPLAERNEVSMAIVS
jgi:hypothetical protein